MREITSLIIWTRKLGGSSLSFNGSCSDAPGRLGPSFMPPIVSVQHRQKHRDKSTRSLKADDRCASCFCFWEHVFIPSRTFGWCLEAEFSASWGPYGYEQQHHSSCLHPWLLNLNWVGLVTWSKHQNILILIVLAKAILASLFLIPPRRVLPRRQ